MTDTIWQSIFIVSRRDSAESISAFIAQSLSLTPVISCAIDRQGDRMLDLSESAKSFKRYTNLPEQVNLCVGARVMFLNNSLIQHRISNGTTGVIAELLEYDDDSVYPIVVFPTPNGAEVMLNKPLLPLFDLIHE
jgi:hypothetical protein